MSREMNKVKKALDDITKEVEAINLGINDDTNYNDLIYLFDELKEKKTEIDKLKLRIENLTDTESETMYSAVGETSVRLRSLLMAAHARINKITNPGNSSPSTLPKNTSNPANPQQSFQKTAKLPTIGLTVFSGELDQYLTFWNSFQSKINTRNDISDVDKFQYFQYILQGDPLEFTHQYDVTQENYKVMLEEFDKKYRKTNELVYMNLATIFNINNIKKKNAHELKSLVNKTKTALQNLKTLKQPVNQWDAILDKIILDKLDSNTLEKWKFSKRGNYDIPPLNDLLEFIEGVAYSIESDNLPPVRVHQINTNIRVKSSFKCKVCAKENHQLYQCQSYLNLSQPERYKKVKALKLCFNCLSPHTFANCQNTRRCQKCSFKHHTTLHRETPRDRINNNPHNEREKTRARSKSSSSQRSTSLIVSNHQTSSVLLATALVSVIDDSGREFPAKILLDSGSQCSLVSKAFAKLLNCQRKNISVDITGVGAQIASTAKQSISLSFTSRFDKNVFFKTDALIIDQLTLNLPEKSFTLRDTSHIQGLQLADPTYNVSSKIDIILGGALAFDILFGHNKIDFPAGTPSSIATPLGHVLLGNYNSALTPVIYSGVTLKNSPQDLISKLWELENIYPNSKVISKSDRLCEDLFAKSIRQNPQGKFVTDLLFKEFPPKLGNSFNGANKRFQLLENRFKKNQSLKIEYSKVFKEYLELGHMIKIENPNFNIPHNYMPQHPVIKTSSVTTKLRIVFDGSFATSNGISLNQTLLTGPSLQTDIRHLLLRFRFFEFVITADIIQMYRQIEINPEHQEYLRVLWRDNPNEELNHYKLTTLPFGLSQSPYIAIRIIHYLADLHEINYPEASLILKEHFYVDDLVTGSNSKSKLIQNIEQISTIFKQAGFYFDKWTCNDKSILKKLQTLGYETNSKASLSLLSSSTTLGINWSIDSDRLSFKFEPPSSDALTKRILLSTLAKIYDPLGILSPFLILLKFILQDAWSLKLQWDNSLPDHHQEIWRDLLKHFHLLNKFDIPRLAINNKAAYYEIHAFADASTRGIGICAYLLSFDNQNLYNSHLLFAKSKLAPLHFVTIARLELLSCHLLATTYQFYNQIIPVKLNNVYFYSDSQIALSWIKSENLQFKTFVANRVHDINSLVPEVIWKYVNTSINPADIVSRGISISKLLNNKLWLQGPFHEPSFKENLKNSSPLETILQSSKQNSEFAEEIRPVKLISCIAVFSKQLLNKYSNLNKLQRVIAYCLRFFQITHHKKSFCNTNLSIEEMDLALNKLLILSQKEHFSVEYKLLKNSKPILKNSNLKSLNPFFDKKSNLIRVGGRLTHSSLSYNAKYPIIIAYQCNLSTLIVRQAHYQFKHADFSTLAAYIRNNYWIPRLRNIIRRITHECMICHRFKVIKFKQIMGNIPASRLTPSATFAKTGIDCAGPFMVASTRHRGVKYHKYYICLFVCFSTRAIHLEYLSSLSAECFLMSLDRFISRRGCPQQIFSDCGTNFVGCHKELKEIYDFFLKLNDDPQAAQYALMNHIQWNFNPPSSPHFGSLWESNIKSMKYYLKRSCNNLNFTLEEFESLIFKVEAILNSRPICPLSDTLDDFDILTPGHFLIGRPLTAIPEHDLADINQNRLSKWQIIQQRTQFIWKKWASTYLHSLQQRRKWLSTNDQPYIGQLVLLCEAANPLQWKRGRILELFPGKDNIARVAKIQTPSGTYLRPLIKLAPLLTDNHPLDTLEK